MAAPLDSPPSRSSRHVDWSGPLTSRYLMAGELHASNTACAVNTVLGSCVAVTMLHAKSGLASICHAMLPRPRAVGDMAVASSERFKYVSEVVPAMLEFFAFHGVGPRHLEVKVFGGANVLEQPAEPWNGAGVGQANIVLTRELLAAAGARLHGEDVGGPYGRRLIFNTLSGRVLLKYINSRMTRDVAQDR